MTYDIAPTCPAGTILDASFHSIVLSNGQVIDHLEAYPHYDPDGFIQVGLEQVITIGTGNTAQRDFPHIRIRDASDALYLVTQAELQPAIPTGTGIIGSLGVQFYNFDNRMPAGTIRM